MPIKLNSNKTFLSSLIILTIIYLGMFFYTDRFVAIWMNEHISGTFPLIVNYFSSMAGSTPISYLALFSFILYIFLRKTKYAKTIFCFTAALCITIVIKDVLKFTLGRARPVELIKENIYGMHWFKGSKEIYESTPSGHSARSMVVCTSIALMIKHKWAWIVFITFALMHASARVILIKHYPGDVMFGAYLGFFIAVWVRAAVFPEEF